MSKQTTSVKKGSGNNILGRLKKLTIITAISILISFVLTACSLDDAADIAGDIASDIASDIGEGAQIAGNELEEMYEDLTSSSSDEDKTSDSIDSQTGSTGDLDIYESIIESASGDEYPTSKMQKDMDDIGLSDDMIEDIQSDQAGYYYYEQLDDDQKKLYASILYILTCQAKDIYITTTDMDEVETVQQCVLNDHPEIFYVDGYSMNRYMDNATGDIKAITYGGSYTLSSSQISDRQVRLLEAADSIIGGMPDTSDEYEIVKYFYDYIVLNTKYSIGSADNQNICSVLLNKESVCQGYAKTLQYLLQKVGITCEMVSGTVDNGETTSNHAWDIVKIDGNWYYVDPTWGDSSFSGSAATDTEVVNYAYLCVTTKELSATHKINEVVKMPECSATSDNYFVRENALFDSVDTAKLSGLFNQAITSGRSSVTFKCTDTDSYNEMKTYLFGSDGGCVFEYLPAQSTKAVYLAQDSTLTFIVWL